VEKKLELKQPPLGKGQDVGGKADPGVRLAKSLKEATEKFMRPESVAREVFGDEFVEHYGGTREHEVKLWDEAVTDWYVSSRPPSMRTRLTLGVGKCGGISKPYKILSPSDKMILSLLCLKLTPGSLITPFDLTSI
jgi:Glutamine synthetase, catalytic domain